MASADYDRYQLSTLSGIAVSYECSYDQLAGAMTETAWYRAIGARLDQLEDYGHLFVGRFQLAWHPARYVWVDSRLRVWRSDEGGCLTCTATLSLQESGAN